VKTIQKQVDLLCFDLIIGDFEDKLLEFQRQNGIEEHPEESITSSPELKQEESEIKNLEETLIKLHPGDMDKKEEEKEIIKESPSVENHNAEAPENKNNLQPENPQIIKLSPDEPKLES
jgi:hypothetical protein